MKRNSMKTMAAMLVATGILTVSAWASYGASEHAGAKGPPPEALEACSEKSEGTAVEMATPKGEVIKATCKMVNDNLVAVPEGGFPPPGSPPEGAGEVPQGGPAARGDRL
jgi:hypothetical protein